MQDISTPRKPDYLFVAGCPRSGTTALGRFLAMRDDVVMGIERYALRATRKNFSLAPELYELERFKTFMPGDTFYDSLDFAREAHRSLDARLPSARYVGDKIPMLFGALPELFQAFGPNTKVVLIYRNIFDVAASYETRLRKPDDKWSRTASDAVINWNASLKAYKTSAHKDQIIPVIYEDIFADPARLVGLLERLGLSPTEEDRLRAVQTVEKAHVLDGARNRQLSTGNVMDITMNAQFGAFREIVNLARAA